MKGKGGRIARQELRKPEMLVSSPFCSFIHHCCSLPDSCEE